MLDGVVDEVLDDATDQHRVAGNAGRRRVDVDRDRDAPALGPRAGEAGDGGDQLGRREGLARSEPEIGLDSAEIEHVVGHGDELLDRLLEQQDIVARLTRRELAGGQKIDDRAGAGEGGADLVRSRAQPAPHLRGVLTEPFGVNTVHRGRSRLGAWAHAVTVETWQSTVNGRDAKQTPHPPPFCWPMLEIAAVVAPVFGLIGLGFLSARLRLITGRTGEGLAEYVFTLAIPFLLFRTIVDADLPPSLPWAYWTSYFVGVAIAWILATVLARAVFARSQAESVIFGFAAGQANTVMVGVPLILKAFGDAAAAPLVLLLAIHLPVTMTAATLLFEGAGPGGRRAALIRVARSIATHPILVGIALGILARETGIRPAGAVRTMVDLMAASATPCSLVAMGIALDHYGIRGQWRAAVAISVLKLVLHPLIVYAMARGVFGLPPVWAGVGLLFAACPSGINVYLFASRVRTGEATASAAVSASTGLAVLTVAGWLYFLGIGR